jgi:type II secretory pathway pseudopilin PulG
LFELLVVLAVAAILTVFFVYSAQYLMVSTRVSRVKEEQRVLTRALQNYETDYGACPNMKTGLHALYAPVAYMVRIPPDPFSVRGDEEYVYISSPGGGYRWLLVSQGPDHHSDLFPFVRGEGGLLTGKSEDNSATLSLRSESVETLLTRFTYDPTNGLISGGDIIAASR